MTRAALEAAAAAALGRGVRLESAAAVSGGCINDCYLLDAGAARLFVKLNEPRFADAFAAEADGLAALRAAGMRAPEPLAHGTAAGRAYLALEALELGGDEDFAALGRALAALHRLRGGRFGWSRDNYIGASAQRNSRSSDWIEFWRERRLAPQLRLALANGHTQIRKPVERLCAALPELLAGHTPVASLLHGDLWRGNVGFLAGGAPVVFDPALYRGDRETDLAMSELFGAFPRAFYAAYEESWPLDEGYRRRKHLYNLYHLLNHLNLFGGGYLAQVRATLGLLLRAL
ncbi:MAG TPA: fructosamine kinase family protein [Burkholderiales bacterium]|nr:fructosamine kinase family protein [Burkholderiales bacterium]